MNPSRFGSKRVNKFRAVRTEFDGHAFASRAEALRYAELKLLVRAGAISDLALQPKFQLSVNGHKIASYVADFSYSQDGRTIVEDVKSPATRTPVYRLKAKLMKALHGIDVSEVMKR